MEIPETARPWITRRFGECAYPVDGDGADTWSCCAKVDGGQYCSEHRLRMTTESKPKKVRDYLPRRAA